MRKISKSLMGAAAFPLVLSVLRNEDTYGYEIMKKVKELSEERIIWKEGSLYPVLKKMEQLKYIKSYWIMKDSLRPRKYYKMLTAGQTALEESKEDFALVQGMMKKLWAQPIST